MWKELAPERGKPHSEGGWLVEEKRSEEAEMVRLRVVTGGAGFVRPEATGLWTEHGERLGGLAGREVGS